ncbi:MAG: hypothetical protein WB239_13390 [Acidimicrobiia bacterium]
MSTPEAITQQETGGSARLWMGILVGPIAWAVQLGADWYLAEVVACSPGSSVYGTVGGASLHLVTGVLNGVLLLATIASGWVARGCLVSIRGGVDDTPGQRAEWMALSGILISITFAVVIAASYVAIPFTSSGCSP